MEDVDLGFVERATSGQRHLVKKGKYVILIIFVFAKQNQVISICWHFTLFTSRKRNTRKICGFGYIRYESMNIDNIKCSREGTSLSDSSLSWYLWGQMTIDLYRGVSIAVYSAYKSQNPRVNFQSFQYHTRWHYSIADVLLYKDDSTLIWLLGAEV